MDTKSEYFIFFYIFYFIFYRLNSTSKLQDSNTTTSAQTQSWFQTECRLNVFHACSLLVNIPGQTLGSRA